MSRGSDRRRARVPAAAEPGQLVVVRGDDRARPPMTGARAVAAPGKSVVRRADDHEEVFE